LSSIEGKNQRRLTIKRKMVERPKIRNIFNNFSLKSRPHLEANRKKGQERTAIGLFNEKRSSALSLFRGQKAEP